jgi:hypothetical protein
MKWSPPRLTHGLVATLLALTVSTTAHADLFSREKPAPARRRPAMFHVSGVYSGVLNGQILVDGTALTLAGSPAVHAVGAGSLELRDLPIGCRVHVSGQVVGRTQVVMSVIARPGEDSSARPGTARVRENSSSEE